MNQDERQKFWDVLLSMHDTEPEHIQALHEMISVPHTLCRFRSVNESSLTQLQENKLYFSSADYYDDPFDTYFYLDYDMMETQMGNIIALLGTPENRKTAVKLVSSLGIRNRQISRRMDTHGIIVVERFATFHYY